MVIIFTIWQNINLCMKGIIMRASPLTKSLERLTENRLASSLLSLTTLISGIVTVSLPLLILSGILAYGWPFFNVYLSGVNARADEAAKPARKTLTPIRTSALAAH